MSKRHITDFDRAADIAWFAEQIARRTREEAIAAHRAIRQAEREAGIYVYDGEITDITITPTGSSFV
jgi:hypothetical protein